MASPRLLRRLAALSLATAVGCQAIENRLLYYPAAASDEGVPLPAPLEDITLALADGTKIHARWLPYPGATGAILYCHGNGGNLEQRAGLVKQLSDAVGESVLIFDYPGYGRSEGTPSEAGCYASGQLAYDWLVRARKIPPERIVLYGESLGGAVAADLASRQPHRALVLCRTFTSIPEVAEDQFPLLIGEYVVSSRFDNLKKLPLCRQPVFIAQADQDRIIPFRHGKRLLDACGGPAEFCHLKNLGHNDPLPDDFYVALRRFLANGPTSASAPAFNAPPRSGAPLQ